MGLIVYTDGGCSGNPGPGGWAYVILVEERGGGSLPPGARQDAAPHPPLLGASAPKTPHPPQGPVILAEKWGAAPATTNNRMELMAVISALETLPSLGAQGRITVYTDSQYVQKGITQWIHTWKRNNWRTGGKTPVKNQDLWQRLDALAGRYQLIWGWIRGHAGNEMNERCDRMTQEAIRSLR
ncbi:MAG: ribonuclease HI [Treponema sp.]|nr:ribonuclease HI [Treponema sp.]